MLPVIDFIYNNRFKSFWDQRIAWKTYMYDIRGLSPVEKELVMECIIKRHAEDSKDLDQMYPSVKGWFKRGAWQQAVLDEQLFNMMTLLTNHSDI